MVASPKNFSNRAGNKNGKKKGPLYLILLLAAIAVVSLVATWLVDIGGIEKVTDTEMRANLLAEVKKAEPLVGYEPVVSTNLSNLIFDYDVKGPQPLTMPWAAQVPRSPGGLYLYAWRVRVAFNASISVTKPKGDERFNLAVSSADGAPVFLSTSRLSLPGEEVDIPAGIYLVQVLSDKTLDSFTLNFDRASDYGSFAGGAKETQPLPTKLREVNLEFGPRAMKDFQRLVSLAEGSTKIEIVKMPGGRVDATFLSEEGARSVDVKVGLSGRSREHLKDFPSIDVKVGGGKSYAGLPSFKLYRLDTKSGVMDFVTLSVLRDMGFFVPRHDVVKLSVNGEYRGLYYLMETVSTALFTGQKRLEGSILGVDGDKMFFDYPYGGTLDARYFHNTDGASKKSARYFLSRDFNKDIDRRKSAAYIAFSSVFLTVHGLGVDDLRFYKDPATNLMTPLPRDLNPGAWLYNGNSPDDFRSYLSHMPYSPNAPLYTLWPVKRLLPGGYSYNRSENLFQGIYTKPTATGVTDIHFAFSTFLNETEGLGLTNQYLSYISGNKALENMLNYRVLNALALILESGNKDPLVRWQWSSFSKTGFRHLGDFIKNHIFDNGIEFSTTTEGKGFYWNNRTSQKLRKGLRPSFVSPMGYQIRPKEIENQFRLSFLLDKKVFEILKEEGLYDGPTSYVEEEVGDESISLPPVKNDIAFPPSGRGNERKLSDVAVHLSTTYIDDDTALILFLVRNATERAETYSLKLRDGLRIVKPSINKLFTLYPSKEESRVTLKQILINHFLLGEKMRLLAFEMELGKGAAFYSMNSPKQGYTLMPPMMYLPARSRAGGLESATESGPEGVIGGDRPAFKGLLLKVDGYHIPANTKLRVESDIVLPEGSALFIHEGVELGLAEGVSIKVRGDLRISGTPERPVRFLSASSPEKAGAKAGGTWGGLYAAGTDEKPVRVLIENAIFSDYGSFPKTRVSDLMLNGGITFYHADIVIKNAKFLNAGSEDAVNLISSVADIDKMTVVGAYSDAVDLDFSLTDIDQLSISGSGGDGLDASFSLVRVSRSDFTGQADKGMSVGEMSNIYVFDSKFTGNDMGIANKDQSHLRVKGSLFKDNRVAISEFIKKPYFGKPIAEIAMDNRYEGNDKKYEWLGFYSY